MCEYTSKSFLNSDASRLSGSALDSSFAAVVNHYPCKSTSKSWRNFVKYFVIVS